MTVDGTAAFVVQHAVATQVFLFGLVLTATWIAERIHRPQPTMTKLRHTRFNASFLSGVLPIQLLMMVPCIAAANWATEHHFGLLYFLPHAQSPWLKYGLMFLALDFLDYMYHTISHKTRIWRLHLVHHTDESVDVSTTFREHPGETFLRTAFLILWIVLCGASVGALVLRQTVQTFFNIFQHTSFRLPGAPARAMGWLFITPNLHHAHHHSRLPGTDCNYGDVFSLWDRMFGTFVDISAEETEFGLDTHKADGASTNVLQLLGFRAPLSSSPANSSETIVLEAA